MRAAIEHRTLTLPDGNLGYFMRRTDDCLRAACRTAAQIADVPDPRFDERLAAGEERRELLRSAFAELELWARGHGLRIIVHRKVPARRRRWVGVVPPQWPGPHGFEAHCLVMDRDRLYFDPASGLNSPAGLRLLGCDPDEIAWGFSFERRKDVT